MKAIRKTSVPEVTIPRARRVHPDDVRTARSYWTFCLVLLPVVVFSAFNRPWHAGADMWETAAAIRAASYDLWHPTNPLLALPGETSPRFTPYVIFWGAVMHFSGLGLFTVVGLAGIANYVLFVTGLARWVTRQTRQRQLALFTLLAMLFIAGNGYMYAQAYQFGFFLASLALVGMFTYGLSFHALADLKEYLDRGKPGKIVSYALLSTLVFLTHPITAAFIFVVALAVLFAEGNRKQQLIRLQLVPLLALGIALLWPYFNYWDVLVNGSTSRWFPSSLFKHQIARMGTAFLGLFIVGYFAYRRRHKWLVLGSLFCLVIYAGSGAIKFLMGSRFLLYGAILLHIGIALYLAENWPNWWRNVSLRQRRGLGKLAIVLLIVLPSLPFRVHEVWLIGRDVAHAAFDVPREPETTAERFDFLANRLGPGDIVMAEDGAGWPVPAVTGAKIVWQQKGNPLITPELDRRRADAQSFFRAQLALEQRQALLNRYHATHILMESSRHHRWDVSLLAQLPSLATPDTVRGEIVLHRVW